MFFFGNGESLLPSKIIIKITDSGTSILEHAYSSDNNIRFPPPFHLLAASYAYMSPDHFFRIANMSRPKRRHFSFKKMHLGFHIPDIHDYSNSDYFINCPDNIADLIKIGLAKTPGERSRLLQIYMKEHGFKDYDNCKEYPFDFIEKELIRVYDKLNNKTYSYEYVEQCLERSVLNSPANYATILVLKAWSLAKLGESELSMQCLERAKEIYHVLYLPNVLVLTGKGVCLYELHRYKEALECYDQALKIDPTNAYME